MLDLLHKLLSDNTTTIYDISNVHFNQSELCYSIISDTLAWAEDKNIWITTS